MSTIVAGIDFGTDSVRVLLCDGVSGVGISTGVSHYRRWKRGEYCDPRKNRYRQHALDYIESLEKAFNKALTAAPEHTAAQIAGISVDTTGSTPCPVDSTGTPLCLLDRFTENPDAMFHLWKDHTAVTEAQRINGVLSEGDIDYTKYQGVYSSEWFWAKILHTTTHNAEIRKNAYTWVEHSDWILALLTDQSAPELIKRGSCAAGHKALWNSEFNGLPSRDLLSRLDPYLADIYDRYPDRVYPAGSPVGKLCRTWAERLGLPEGIIIGMGSFDAHAGGVGAGIRRTTMVKVVGTSTVDLVIENPEQIRGKDLREICGQAEDSIVPGYMGIEAGQPAFGDAYTWVKKIGLWAIENIVVPEEVIDSQRVGKLETYLEKQFIPRVEKAAERYIDHEEIALDWFNGRRYPSLNESVKSMLSHITLGTDLPALFCAVAKGTIFGSRAIFDSLRQNGVEIDEIICVGGIAEKSPFIMQMFADALKVPIQVCSDKQVCARGAAIYASVAAGLWENIPQAQKIFVNQMNTTYAPDSKMSEVYDRQFKTYQKIGTMSETLSEYVRTEQ